jgi:hypothetical protein
VLERLIEESRGYDEHKRSFGPGVARHQYSFDPNTADLVVGPTLGDPDGASLTPTDWAFSQICKKLGSFAFGDGSNKSLPADYLMACPRPMRAEQLNHWLEYNDRMWLARAYRDQCRAVLSGRYAQVDVTETLEWIRNAIDSKGGQEPARLYNPAVTPDVLHLRVLYGGDINIGPGRNHEGGYGTGTYITTGEIGNRRIGVYSLIKRNRCDNSIIIAHGAFSWDHNHVGSRIILKQSFIGAIWNAIEGSAEALERLVAAETEEIPDFTQTVESMAKARGWTVEVKDNILMGVPDAQETLFGLVNGVSAAAKKMEDPDQRAEMEVLAGSLLFPRDTQTLQPWREDA